MLSDLSFVVRMGRWYDFLNMQTCPNMLSVLEMDSAEFSTLVSDPKAAHKFRAATVEYARSSLTGDGSLEHSISTTSSLLQAQNGRRSNFEVLHSRRAVSPMHFTQLKRLTWDESSNYHIL